MKQTSANFYFFRSTHGTRALLPVTFQEISKIAANIDVCIMKKCRYRSRAGDVVSRLRRNSICGRRASSNSGESAAKAPKWPPLGSATSSFRVSAGRARRMRRAYVFSN